MRPAGQICGRIGEDFTERPDFENKVSSMYSLQKTKKFTFSHINRHRKVFGYKHNYLKKL